MQYDYYRREITGTIQAGVADDDHFRVKVFGKQDSKHLNVTPDQLHVLANVMDETNPPSLLHMENGSRVIMADVHFDGRGVGTGIVLAEYEDQLVTWRVWLHKGKCRWLAESGQYFESMDRAVTNYNERRNDSPAPAKTISVGIIEHKHGSNSYVGKDVDAVMTQIAGFADEWWDSDEPKPDDQSELIGAYFDGHDDESYIVTVADMPDELA